VVPGKLIVDPPTLENLGFRWYIEGDSNRNAWVEVAYRRRGDKGWKPGLPMLRVHHEIVGLPNRVPWRCGNLFAGSVLFLQPGTTYEVELTLRDPDAEEVFTKALTATTRAEPAAFAGGRTLRVYPMGEANENGYTDLMAAYDAAVPGDVILLHAGVYRGRYRLTKSGEPGKPIVFRGAGDGEVVLQPPELPDVKPDSPPLGNDGIFNVNGAHYLYFEGLTFRTGGIQAGGKGDAGSVGLVVRRCRFENIVEWTAISTGSENSKNWYIADNVVLDNQTSWHLYKKYGKSTGINVYGRGHVVCYNRVSGWGDCLAIYNFGPPLEDVDKHCVAIDFYNNDLSTAWDDHVEADYGCHNVRVYRNRCANAHTGLSTQPFYGGPVYLIRNEMYAVHRVPFKLNCFPAGIEAYNNTACAAVNVLTGYGQNQHFRNNLFLGGDPLAAAKGLNESRRKRALRQAAYSIHGGTMTPGRSTMDYNGYYKGPDPNIHLLYWRHGRNTRVYDTLAEFTEQTGFEARGVVLDYDVFKKAAPPKVGVTYRPLEYDLQLKPDADAIDAGMVLPNVTDNFTGEAPDLGCYEAGAPPPHYGPRER